MCANHEIAIASAVLALTTGVGEGMMGQHQNRECPRPAAGQSETDANQHSGAVTSEHGRACPQTEPAAEAGAHQHGEEQSQTPSQQPH